MNYKLQEKKTAYKGKNKKKNGGEISPFENKVSICIYMKTIATYVIPWGKDIGI